jgi:hypothetical protein
VREFRFMSAVSLIGMFAVDIAVWGSILLLVRRIALH